MSPRVIRAPKDNNFCGPAALSILTNRPVAEVVEYLRQGRGRAPSGRRRAIRGVATWEMRHALEAMGFGVRSIESGGTLLTGFIPRAGFRPTLAKLLRSSLKNRRADQRYLITLTGHFVVLIGRKIYDNHNPDGIWVRQYQHRRKRVRSAFEVVPIPTATATASAPV